LGSACIAAFGKPFLRQQSHWPCILGAVAACVLSVITLANVAGHHHPLILDQYIWFQAGDVQVGFSMRADALSAVMLVTVTFIGSLIAIYSSGYMHGDPGYPRFFAVVSLFLAAMTTLVLANNFILLYAGWEGVGVCSYLLIGFWFAKPSAAAAARKAFLVTRLGDIGLFLGILLLWSHCGYSLEYGDVFTRAAGLDPAVLTVACLLLFTGAVGKSAQFPLHVWLPDAMEVPSPVSALIHAATMVTAGVYLVARCTPLFGLSPEAQVVVAIIGGFTSLLAALIALTQTDLKRVLAYSTVSQLGYMFLALGSGVLVMDTKLAVFGVTAAIFHLVTHAFFKALLFLGAGSVMHAMGDVIDMRKFSGLRKVLPTTHWTFLVGSLALAGFPLLSGFWSKDEILAVCFQASNSEGRFATVYLILFFSALITAGLTAYYTFRGYFMTFWGDLKIPDEAYMHHGHGGHDKHVHHEHNHDTHGKEAEIHRDPNKRFESGLIMTVPLMILAAGSAFIGAILGATGLIGHFLEEHWMVFDPADGGFPGIIPRPVEHHHNLLLMAGSSLFALGGIALAYFVYVKHPAKAADMANSMKGLYGLSRNKFYLDELFALLFVAPLTMAAQLARLIDTYIVDGVVDLIGQLPAAAGQALKPLQNGLVQFYALLMALGVAGFMLAVLLR
jgi:proton-translocating NADH-quinone oxidoreductase chain L